MLQCDFPLFQLAPAQQNDENIRLVLAQSSLSLESRLIWQNRIMGGNLSLWINKELREEMEGNGYIHSVYIVLKGKNNISGFFFLNYKCQLDRIHFHQCFLSMVFIFPCEKQLVNIRFQFMSIFCSFSRKEIASVEEEHSGMVGTTYVLD